MPGPHLTTLPTQSVWNEHAMEIDPNLPVTCPSLLAWGPTGT